MNWLGRDLAVRHRAGNGPFGASIDPFGKAGPSGASADGA